MDNEIWSFETENFRVVATAEPEEIDPADSFEFEDDIEFARSGDPAHWFCAVVTVFHKPTGMELGSDCLGGCSYNSFEEFVSGHRQGGPENRNTLAMKARNIVIGHYFPDMVAEAISRARASLSSLPTLRRTA